SRAAALIVFARLPAWAWRLYWRIFSQLHTAVWVKALVAVASPLAVGMAWFILKPLVVGRDPWQRNRVRLGKPGEGSVPQEDRRVGRFLRGEKWPHDGSDHPSLTAPDGPETSRPERPRSPSQ